MSMKKTVITDEVVRVVFETPYGDYMVGVAEEDITYADGSSEVIVSGAELVDEEDAETEVANGATEFIMCNRVSENENGTHTAYWN